MAGHRSCSLYALLRDVIGRINAFPSACSLNGQNLKKYRVVSCVRLTLRGLFVLVGLLFLCPRTFAQESPYIVTYDHYLEEPGSLEVEYFSTFGTQRGGNDFHAFWGEFEYGATAWWTTEFYLDGQTTFHDSTSFTGFRWENRFRPLQQEHFINPVIYIADQ